MTFQQKDFIGRNYFLIRNSDFNKFSDLPKANYEYLHFVENLRSFLTGSHDLIL